MAERIVRTGVLDEAALIAALGEERRTGRRPTQLAVGSRQLELVAVRILSPQPGSLGDLLASVPNVLLDETMPGDGWELREGR